MAAYSDYQLIQSVKFIEPLFDIIYRALNIIPRSTKKVVLDRKSDAKQLVKWIDDKIVLFGTIAEKKIAFKIVISLSEGVPNHSSATEILSRYNKETIKTQLIITCKRLPITYILGSVVIDSEIVETEYSTEGDYHQEMVYSYVPTLVLLFELNSFKT